MSEPSLLLEIRDGVAHMTLNRPASRNAMNRELLQSFSSAIERLQASPQVRFLIICGAGGHFSAGADLKELAQSSPEGVREIAQLAVSAFNALERLPIVSIAAIEGFAVGGGLELAEACSLRVCAEDSRLGHPEVRVGAVAGFGGTTRLMRTVGRGRATEMLLTGRLLSAEEALNLGIVTQVAAPGKVLDMVEETVGRLRQTPFHALRYTLLAVQAAAEASTDGATRAGAAFFGLAAAEPEFREAVANFFAHRTEGR